MDLSSHKSKERSLNPTEILMKLFNTNTEYTLFYIRKRLSSRKDKDLKAIVDRLLRSGEEIEVFLKKEVPSIGEMFTKHTLILFECIENLLKYRERKLKTSTSSLFESSKRIGEEMNRASLQFVKVDFVEEFVTVDKFILSIALSLSSKNFEEVITLSDSYQNCGVRIALLIEMSILRKKHFVG